MGEIFSINGTLVVCGSIGGLALLIYFSGKIE
jgi:hypothetical protein